MSKSIQRSPNLPLEYGLREMQENLVNQEGFESTYMENKIQDRQTAASTIGGHLNRSRQSYILITVN